MCLALSADSHAVTCLDILKMQLVKNYKSWIVDLSLCQSVWCFRSFIVFWVSTFRFWFLGLHSLTSKPHPKFNKNLIFFTLNSEQLHSHLLFILLFVQASFFVCFSKAWWLGVVFDSDTMIGSEWSDFFLAYYTN